MEPEQAREILQSIANGMNGTSVYVLDGSQPNVAEALQMGADALEKQIPKKPKIEKYKKKRDKGYYCSNCGNWLGTVGIPIDIEDLSFCPTCGQKIDWTEESDN